MSHTTSHKPKSIYHYCGVSGFRGILESKSLWLSDAYLLNDYMEHRWVLDRVVANLKQLRAQDELRSACDALLEAMSTPAVRPIHPYVCCFSLEPDLLSQWRAYSDDGAGFAIGFSTIAIEKRCAEIARQCSLGLSLKPVEYETAKQDEFTSNVLANYLSFFPKESSEDIWPLAIKAYGELWTIAALCKNDRFCEENECRITLMPKYTEGVTLAEAYPEIGPSKMLFRVSGGRIIPYFTVPFAVEDVVELRLGPKNQAREAWFGVDLFLRQNGYDLSRINIIKSEATYR
jgi:hypothetical protein